MSLIIGGYLSFRFVKKPKISKHELNKFLYLDYNDYKGCKLININNNLGSQKIKHLNNTDKIIYEYNYLFYFNNIERTKFLYLAEDITEYLNYRGTFQYYYDEITPKLMMDIATKE